MDLLKMIAELQAERDRLDQAIIALERLSAGKAKRRGRPPRWLREEMQKSEQEGSPARPDDGKQAKKSS
ncbi:MAG: hypothetical protein JOY54_01955 [Acidobacteriaceae bacterium]|nr:hypothetical protein [Acidobacteriaceae bacterium]